jgi:membrane fusion protein, multidrug efflux system
LTRSGIAVRTNKIHFMTKPAIALLALAVAAAVGGGLWWRSHSAAQPAAGAATGAVRPPQAVTVFTVLKRDVPVTVRAAGTVVPLNTVELRPQQSTTIKTIHIREGQTVRQGDLLFSFDDRADQANLDKARATLLRDQATLADLQRQWQRSKDLKAQNFIAQNAVDSIQSQVEAQQALVVADTAAVRAAQVSTSLGQLRAPLSGRTGAITVNPGSLVQPGGAALVTISQMDPIAVSFSVPEGQLSALLQDSAGGGGVQGRALQVLPDEGSAGGQGAAPGLPGKISFLDNTVDVSTGTLRLKGEVANTRQQLWPGQFVTVAMTLRTLKDASVLPQSALIIRGDERLVYVVDADNKAQLKPVKLRFNAGEMVAVDGVAPGDAVVMEGKQNLRPGGAVKVVPAGPGRAASAAGRAASAAQAGAPA